MATRTSAVRLAVEGIDSSIAALRRAGDEGQRELERIGVGANNATRSMERLEKATSSVGNYSRSNIFQQLGYQVGDFAVQVQGGTSVVTAFVQQGSQIAGAFGPAGAVIGALGAIVGGAYTYFAHMSEGVDDATTELKKLTEGTESYGEALKNIQPLQESFLQGIVRGQTAIENQAKATAAAAAKSTEDMSSQFSGIPGLGYVDPNARTTGESGRYGPPTLPQQLTELRATYTEAEKRQQALNADRLRDEKAIQDYLDNREEARVKKRGVNVGPGGFETSGGSFRDAEKGSLEDLSKYDLQQDQQRVAEADRAREQAKRKAEQDARAAETKAATAARQAEALAERQKNIIDAEKLAVQSAIDLADAQDLSTEARERAQRSMESEQRILQASHTLNAQQLEDYKKDEATKLAAEDRRAATAAKNKADMALAQERIDQTPASMAGFYDKKYSGKNVVNPAVDDPHGIDEDELKRQSDIQRDILIQPWKDLASQISQIMAGVFDGILSDAQGLDFGDIGTNFATSIRQSASSALSSIVTMPLTSTVSELARMQMQPGQTMGGMFQQFGSQHPYLAAGGLGYLGGQIGGQLLGSSSPYSGIGGGLGSAAGYGLGNTLLPGVGGIPGAILGGLAGTALGSLFGGSDKPNDNSSQEYRTGAGRITYSDKSFSSENRSVTAGVLGQVGQLQEALEGLGGTFGNLALKVEAGNNSGIKVNGKEFGSADEATGAALKQLLGSAGNLTASQSTVIANTKGQNAQEIISDLGFAKTFDDLTYSGKEVDRQLRDLYATFDTAARKAGELGLSTDALSAARDREANKLREQAAREERSEGASFNQLTQTDPLTRSIGQIDESFRQAVDHYIDLGYSVDAQNQLWAARIRAIDEVTEQQRRQNRAENASFFQLTQANPLQQAIGQIDEKFREAVDHYRDLGYSVDAENELWAARLREIAQAQEEQRRSDRDLGNQFLSTVTRSSLQRTLLSINVQFAHLTDTLKDAGYSSAALQQIEQARIQAETDAREQQRRQDRDLGAQYLDAVSQSPLEDVLRDIDLKFAHLAETLKDAGYSSEALTEVEKARVQAQTDAIQELKDQAESMASDLQNKVRGVRSFFDDLINPLKAVNNNAVLNPSGQIGVARSTFQEDLAKAQAGDLDATQRLAGEAQSLQSQVTQTYGTGGRGAQYTKEIAAGTSGLIYTLEQEKAAAMASLPTVVDRMRLDVVREQIAAADKIVDKLEQLRRDLANRGIRIAA